MGIDMDTHRAMGSFAGGKIAGWTHTGLILLGFFCKHTMPFLQLWFHSLKLLILVSDQKKTEWQLTRLRREYLDFYTHFMRN